MAQGNAQKEARRKILAIIQARMGSTRLPGKVLMPLGESSCVLLQIVRRVGAANIFSSPDYAASVVVATSTVPADDAIACLCMEHDVTCFRGDPEDVLSRYYRAAVFMKADADTIIIRVTADDPLKAPECLEQAVQLLVERELDFVCNNNPPTFPEGLDTEVFTFDALRQAHEEADEPFLREHVTQFFYKHPERFTQECFSASQDVSWMRWTLDTEDDYRFVKAVYDALGKGGRLFSTLDVLAFLRDNPKVLKLNSNVPRSYMYTNPKNSF